VGHVDAVSLQSAYGGAVADAAGAAGHADVSGREIVAVPVSSLQPGESPRLEGEDKAHIARLAESETPLPPILADRRSMRVIDGIHRLMAASQQGQETIDVEFFDGSAADAFLRAVEANVTHGLPLSQADRWAATARIIASHPQMSDRAIAESAGLAARTVAAIRRRCAHAVPQLNARVGRDGRVRPLSSVEGRRRAAALMAEHPRASLREVARDAGVSPATALDVRRRLERGEEPVPTRSRAGGGGEVSAEPGQAARLGARRAVRVVQPAPAFVLAKLLRDPALRDNERGRRLLRLLQHNSGGAHEWSGVIAAVPPHCAPLVAALAGQYAQMWQDFAQELDERAQVIDPWGSLDVNGRSGRPG
jgi:ParB-like chromosome segregation protein Spo0J